MKILFIHQNFPGQFGHLSEALMKRGDEVSALCIHSRAVPEGIRVFRYKPNKSNTPKIDPLLLDTESKIIRGEAAYIAMQQMKGQGYEPDLIYAHPGWGESLFARDVWSLVPQISYFEFYYHATGADSRFDPEFPHKPIDDLRLKTKNLVNLTNLEECDAGIAPTQWQKSLHPTTSQNKIRVSHDGINTEVVLPDGKAKYTKPATDHTFQAGDEIVTFVSRNLEPYRGYHNFIRSLPKILKERPKAQILIVGEDGVSYGAPPASGTWKEHFFNEIKESIDESRVHFLGKVSYPEFIKILQVSAAHVYLTYPFVLSWSMLEAMSAGCLVIGSSTPPVMEVIDHGKNGLLVDFFNADEIANTVIEAIEHPEKYISLRKDARKTMVEKYDLKKICLPNQLLYIDQIISKHKKIN